MGPQHAHHALPCNGGASWGPSMPMGATHMAMGVYAQGHGGYAQGHGGVCTAEGKVYLGLLFHLLTWLFGVHVAVSTTVTIYLNMEYVWWMVDGCYHYYFM